MIDVGVFTFKHRFIQQRWWQQRRRHCWEQSPHVSFFNFQLITFGNRVQTILLRLHHLRQWLHQHVKQSIFPQCCAAVGQKGFDDFSVVEQIVPRIQLHHVLVSQRQVRGQRSAAIGHVVGFDQPHLDGFVHGGWVGFNVKGPFQNGVVTTPQGPAPDFLVGDVDVQHQVNPTGPVQRFCVHRGQGWLWCQQHRPAILVVVGLPSLVRCHMHVPRQGCLQQLSLGTGGGVPVQHPSFVGFGRGRGQTFRNDFVKDSFRNAVKQDSEEMLKFVPGNFSVLVGVHLLHHFQRFFPCTFVRLTFPKRTHRRHHFPHVHLARIVTVPSFEQRAQHHAGSFFHRHVVLPHAAAGGCQGPGLAQRGFSHGLGFRVHQTNSIRDQTHHQCVGHRASLGQSGTGGVPHHPHFFKVPTVVHQPQRLSLQRDDLGLALVHFTEGNGLLQQRRHVHHRQIEAFGQTFGLRRFAREGFADQDHGHFHSRNVGLDGRGGWTHHHVEQMTNNGTGQLVLRNNVCGCRWGSLLFFFGCCVGCCCVGSCCVGCCCLFVPLYVGTIFLSKRPQTRALHVLVQFSRLAFFLLAPSRSSGRPSFQPRDWGVFFLAGRKPCFQKDGRIRQDGGRHIHRVASTAAVVVFRGG